MTSSRVVTAIRELIMVARTDTPEGVRVRRFLMAWWDMGEYGGFDVLDICSVEPLTKQHISTCISYLATASGVHYPNTISETFDLDMRELTFKRREDLEAVSELPGAIKRLQEDELEALQAGR